MLYTASADTVAGRFDADQYVGLDEGYRRRAGDQKDATKPAKYVPAT